MKVSTYRITARGSSLLMVGCTQDEAEKMAADINGTLTKLHPLVAFFYKIGKAEALFLFSWSLSTAASSFQILFPTSAASLLVILLSVTTLTFAYVLVWPLIKRKR